MNLVVGYILQLEAAIGPAWFGVLSLLVSFILCFKAIPWTTDLMVNNAAGLAGKFLGRAWRTLVINASTNNPELGAMLVSLSIRRMGGVANPIGSLFANCYLMYLIAPILVSAQFILKGQRDSARRLWRLIWQEKKLVAGHLVLALSGFITGNVVLMLMTHGNLSFAEESPPEPYVGTPLFISIGLIAAALVAFFLVDSFLRRRRPELFNEIHEDQHDHSILGFVIGTVGLVVSCWFMNALFLSWTELYGQHLKSVFGVLVFTAIHYFIGAIITSLPELLVAMTNYRRLNSPDLHTAIAGASYSNFTNLAITLFGLLVFTVVYYGFGTLLPWG